MPTPVRANTVCMGDPGFPPRRTQSRPGLRPGLHSLVGYSSVTNIVIITPKSRFRRLKLDTQLVAAAFVGASPNDTCTNGTVGLTVSDIEDGSGNPGYGRKDQRTVQVNYGGKRGKGLKRLHIESNASEDAGAASSFARCFLRIHHRKFYRCVSCYDSVNIDEVTDKVLFGNEAEPRAWALL